MRSASFRTAFWFRHRSSGLPAARDHLIVITEFLAGDELLMFLVRGLLGFDKPLVCCIRFLARFIGFGMTPPSIVVLLGYLSLLGDRFVDIRPAAVFEPEFYTHFVLLVASWSH